MLLALCNALCKVLLLESSLHTRTCTQHTHTHTCTHTHSHLIGNAKMQCGLEEMCKSLFTADRCHEETGTVCKQVCVVYYIHIYIYIHTLTHIMHLNLLLIDVTKRLAQSANRYVWFIICTYIHVYVVHYKYMYTYIL